MEVVVATSILSQVAVFVINRFTSKYDVVARSRESDTLHQAPTNSQPQPQPRLIHVADQQNHQNNTEQSPDESSKPEAESDENSIEFLEHRLKHLKTQAKRLNAPDTLVQYARVTREANKVEKALNEKKAEQRINAAEPLARDAVTGALTKLMKPHVGAVRYGVANQIIRAAPRVISFVFLWYYFSWREGSANQGIAMTVDCQALRPISFLFRKLPPSCLDDDWLCVVQASQAPQCVISYSWALILCNIVISTLLQA